ncbi:MAG: hypothetical protein AB7U45_07975 [Desulfamplus sp.]
MKINYFRFNVKNFFMIFILSMLIAVNYNAASASCLGDNDGDGIVSDQEVKSALNQFLGTEQVLESCDEYGDGVVQITDLQRVIYGHINGCDFKDWYENDNTPESASVIRENGNMLDLQAGLNHSPIYEKFQTHNFDSRDDEDWIKFYAQKLNKAGKPNSYTIDVYDVGSDCNPVIELYDKDNNCIADDKDNNCIVDNHPEGVSEYRKFSPPADGIYYAKIYHSDGSEYKAGYNNYYKVSLSVYSAALQSALFGRVIPSVNGSLPANGVVKTSFYGYSLVWYGWYLMPHDAGEFDLWVEGDGYKSGNYHIKIGEGKTYWYDIQLK